MRNGAVCGISESRDTFPAWKCTRFNGHSTEIMGPARTGNPVGLRGSSPTSSRPGGSEALSRTPAQPAVSSLHVTPLGWMATSKCEQRKPRGICLSVYDWGGEQEGCWTGAWKAK